MEVALRFLRFRPSNFHSVHPILKIKMSRCGSPSTPPIVTVSSLEQLKVEFSAALAESQRISAEDWQALRDELQFMRSAMAAQRLAMAAEMQTFIEEAIRADRCATARELQTRLDGTTASLIAKVRSQAERISMAEVEAIEATTQAHAATALAEKVAAKVGTLVQELRQTQVVEEVTCALEQPLPYPHPQAVVPPSTADDDEKILGMMNSRLTELAVEARASEGDESDESDEDISKIDELPSWLLQADQMMTEQLTSNVASPVALEKVEPGFTLGDSHLDHFRAPKLLAVRENYFGADGLYGESKQA